MTFQHLTWGGAKYAPPPPVFPPTAQGIKLKLSDFKDTPLRHFLQVKPFRYMATKLQMIPRRIWLQRKVKNQPFVKILS